MNNLLDPRESDPADFRALRTHQLAHRTRYLNMQTRAPRVLLQYLPRGGSIINPRTNMPYVCRCKVINTPENIALMEEEQPPQYNTGYDDEIDYTESNHDETSSPQANMAQGDEVTH